MIYSPVSSYGKNKSREVSTGAETAEREREGGRELEMGGGGGVRDGM